MRKVNYYDSAFHISKDLFTYAELKRHLRVYGVGYKDSSIIRDCWIDGGSTWGLPVPFALVNGMTGVDYTPNNFYDWPDVSFKPRHNQEKVIAQLLRFLTKYRCGRIEAPTAWGKTMVALRITQILKTNMLVLVHKEEVLNQFENTAKAFFGVECGYVMGKETDTTKPITLSTMQTMTKRVDTLGDDFLSSFGMLVIDEAHRSGCDSYLNIMRKINPTYRLGISATFRRSDRLEQVWEHYLGPLVGIGKKTDCKLKVHLDSPVISGTGLSIRNFYHKGEVSFVKAQTEIALNLSYNRWIVDRIIIELQNGRRPVITTTRKKQLEILEDMFREKGYTSIGIYAGGKHRDKTIRKKDLIEAAQKDIILATATKIGEGFDLNALIGDELYAKMQPPDTILIAGMSKDTEQQIGRVGRNARSKDPLIIHPIIDIPYCFHIYRSCKKRIYDRLGIYQINLR